MTNFREVNNDDILNKWYVSMEEMSMDQMDEIDQINEVRFDAFYETIMKNIPKKRKKYVENRFKEFSEEYMKYIAYLNEKYYRNGFCDGVDLISGCLRK